MANVAWRVVVSGMADRLEVQLAAANAAGGDAVGGGAPAAGARAAIAQARQIAARQKPADALNETPVALARRMAAAVAGWWSGASIEQAWQALHLAAEQLALIVPAASLPGLFADSDAGDVEGVPGMDPATAQRALVDQHARSDIEHQQIRGLRNIATLLLGTVTIVDGALWAGGYTSGGVLGLGALTGALSAMFAVRGGIPPEPYHVLPAQVMLKVVSGAGTAVAGTALVDYMAGSSGSPLRDGMAAVVFGFTQQGFTRLVDQRASLLSRRVGPRTAHPMPDSMLPGLLARAASVAGHEVATVTHELAAAAHTMAGKAFAAAEAHSAPGVAGASNGGPGGSGDPAIPVALSPASGNQVLAARGPR